MYGEEFGEVEGEEERGVGLDLFVWWGEEISLGALMGEEGGKGYTSPPGLSSRKPRFGMWMSNVQGTFWAEVRMAEME